jgi:hypothetical protein
MEKPSLPLKEYRYESVVKSIIIIIWWIGIWGAADTIIHLVFKGETMMELGIYITMISFVLFMVYLYPDLTLHF